MVQDPATERVAGNSDSGIELSVIVVTWNCWGDLGPCLNALAEDCRAIHHEILVVDNHSAEPPPAGLLEANPSLTFIPLDRNIGFAPATNLGLEQARGRYVLLLNPDTLLHVGAIPACLEFLDAHTEYGGAGVRILGADGRVEFACARRLPTLWRMLCDLVMLDKLLRFAPLFGGVDQPGWDHEGSRDAEMINGAFMLLRKTVIDELGPLATDVPFFLEDVEYCIRLHRHGYRIRYLAEQTMIHFGGRSTGRAEQQWISETRYEARYLQLLHASGAGSARWFVRLLWVALPLKLMLLPLLAVGKWFVRKQHMFCREVRDSLIGLQWSIRKMRDFDRIHCPVDRLPNA